LEARDGSVYFSTSLSKKKFRKVRITAMGANWPICCQKGAIAVPAMSAASTALPAPPKTRVTYISLLLLSEA
jgi:hypothetical protein